MALQSMREENLTDEEWKELERKWAEDEQSDWAKYLKEKRRGAYCYAIRVKGA